MELKLLQILIFELIKYYETLETFHELNFITLL